MIFPPNNNLALHIESKNDISSILLMKIFQFVNQAAFGSEVL